MILQSGHKRIHIQASIGPNKGSVYNLQWGQKRDLHTSFSKAKEGSLHKLQWGRKRDPYISFSKAQKGSSYKPRQGPHCQKEQYVPSSLFSSFSPTEAKNCGRYFDQIDVRSWSAFRSNMKLKRAPLLKRGFEEHAANTFVFVYTNAAKTSAFVSR